MRVWRYPAFLPEVSWAVVGDDDAHFIRRIVFDHRRLTFDPVTYGSEASFPQAELAAMRRDLHALNLPAFPRVATLGIDGCTFGLEAAGSARAAVEWWGEPPEGWQSLAAWHARVCTSFDRYLPACTVMI
jgi:hypothetical protein